MWYFVVFQPSKCKKTHFQPLWSIWPIFPNDSESQPKFCYIKQKNSEILSRLGALPIPMEPILAGVHEELKKIKSKSNWPWSLWDSSGPAGASTVLPAIRERGAFVPKRGTLSGSYWIQFSLGRFKESVAVLSGNKTFWGYGLVNRFCFYLHHAD